MFTYNEPYQRATVRLLVTPSLRASVIRMQTRKTIIIYAHRSTQGTD